MRLQNKPGPLMPGLYKFANIAENASTIIDGTAAVSAEPERKRRYCKGRLRLIFPDGRGGDDYAVIRIRAEMMEIPGFRRNVIAGSFGLRPVVLQKAPGGWVIEASQPLPDDASAAASLRQKRG